MLVLRFIVHAGELAGALLAIAGLLAGAWKARPLWRAACALVADFRAAVAVSRVLSTELRELAGAFVNFAASYAERIDDNTDRLNDLASLYTDLAAAVTRLERAVGRQ